MSIQTIGLLLMSVAILQYTLVPLFADLNPTHATNPKWSSHARFHVVTQVLTGAAIGCLALLVLWSPSIDRDAGVCLAAILSFCVLGAFFTSAALRRLFGGTLSDADGGIPKVRNVDLNLANFGLAAVLLVTGRLLLL